MNTIKVHAKNCIEMPIIYIFISVIIYGKLMERFKNSGIRKGNIRTFKTVFAHRFILTRKIVILCS